MEEIWDLLDKKRTSRARVCYDTIFALSSLTKGHFCGLCLESIRAFPGKTMA